MKFINTASLHTPLIYFMYLYKGCVGESHNRPIYPMQKRSPEHVTEFHPIVEPSSESFGCVEISHLCHYLQLHCDLKKVIAVRIQRIY